MPSLPPAKRPRGLLPLQRHCISGFFAIGSGDTHLAVHSSPTGVIPLKDPFLHELATKYSKDAGQIMLRWNFQRGICVATKSVSEKRIQGNFQILDWEISAEDMTRFGP